VSVIAKRSVKKWEICHKKCRCSFVQLKLKVQNAHEKIGVVLKMIDYIQSNTVVKDGGGKYRVLAHL
jgi:hypothetical protein